MSLANLSFANLSFANLRLAWRSLRRDLRAADVRALFLALVLAVAAATMIAFFLDRIERGLERQAGQLLGGDLVLEQSRPFDQDRAETLREAGFRLSQQTGLTSMLRFNEAFQTVSLKAVDDAYPLYGQVEVDTAQGAQALSHGPSPGNAWLAPRLEILLDLRLGDQIEIGDTQLTVTGWVTREPDQQGGFGNFSPRVILHGEDLAKADLVQPGSRVEFTLLAAGSEAALDRISSILDSWRAQGVEVRNVREDRPQLGNALARAESYLSLAGLAAVLLAGVAVAMSTRRYVERHLDTAALMRCFGASQRQLVVVFSLQLIGLALVASLIGALLGLVGQSLLLLLLADYLPTSLPSPGLEPLLLGILTALAVLIGFAGPTLLRIRRVSALKVLRRELDPLPPSAWLVVGIAALVFCALLWLYSGRLDLAVALVIGGGMVLVLLWGVSLLLFSGLLGAVEWLSGHAFARTAMGRALRLGGRQLARRRQAGLGQLIAFSVTFFAMAMIVLVRGDLLTRWQAQLPDDTPNYFAINIQPDEKDAFAEQIAPHVDTRSTLYPMVRGRVTTINDQPPEQALSEAASEVNALRRELNLTWQAELPPNNRIVEGQWFAESASDGSDSRVPISIESGLAERLGLGLGDRMTFSIGSREIKTRLSSVRDLDWDSFQPNFYVIFPPGVLDQFGHSFITAFYLPDANEGVIRDLVNDFPSVTLLNVDALVGQVREVLDQVTRAVELILGLVLLAGVSVLYAALTASLPVRAHESGLLRVFGAGNRTISQIQGAEYGLLGLASGLLGAVLAELATAVLYVTLLDLTPRVHVWLWWVMPLLGALVIGVIGHWLARPLRRMAPSASLGLLGN